jgi:hypothetical protein
MIKAYSNPRLSYWQICSILPLQDRTHGPEDHDMKHTDVLLSMARQQEREFATAMQRARSGRSTRGRTGRLPRLVGRLVSR